MTEVSEIPDYLTLAEAADVIGVHKSQVSRYIDRGLLEAKRLGLQVLLPEKQVRDFIRPRRGNPNFRRPEEND